MCTTDPAEAVLLHGLEGADLYIAMFMTPFTAVMFGAWVALSREIRARHAPAVAGGARFWDDGFQTRVRLPRVFPAFVGLVVVSCGAFLGVFVIAAISGSNPSLSLMTLAWSLVLAAGALSYLMARRKVAGGTSDLLIDDLNRAVVLPQTFGRTEPQSINSDQLRAIEIDDIVQRTSKRTVTHQYATMLVWHEKNGTVHREKLAVWTNAIIKRSSSPLG